MSAKLRDAIRAVNRGVLSGSVGALMVLGSEGVAAQSATADSGDRLMEEVIVTGIRGSLMQARDVKRFSDVVVDTVSAEDIGKFPDKNVAEALSRVPGVAVSRDFGEGQGVTIRGLAPGNNITLMNGQAVGTAQWFVLSEPERNFNYEMLSPEMLASIQVYKSARADIDEGGLGGTVNLKTRKPLDLPANTLQVSADAQYSDLPEEWDPSASAMYSWKNDDETLGVLVALSRQERTVQREATEMFPAYFNPFSDRDQGFQDALNAPTGADGKGIVPWGVGSALFQQDRERTGADFNVQWKPTERLDATLHYFYTELEADNQNQNFIAIPFRGLFANDTPSAGTTENGIVTSLFVRGGEPAIWANHLAFDSIFREGSSMETDVLDLELNYRGDSWSVHGQIGTTEGEGTNRDFFTEFFAFSQDPRVNFDFFNEGGQNPTIDYSPSPWVTNPGDEMLLTGVFDQVNDQRDEEDYAQIDFEMEVDFGAVRSIKFGAKYREREFSQNRSRDELFNTVVGDVDQSLGTAGDFASGTFTVDHDETSMQTTTVFDVNRNAIWDAFQATPECGSAGVADGDICVGRNIFLAESSFSIEEDITALYGMATFESDRLRGNLGIRYVETETTSNAYDLAAPVLTPTSSSGSYNEVLPSLNLSFDLTDELLLRFAAGRALTRPAPFQLTSAVNLTPETSSGETGNPDLKPLTADQYELGLEWYYGDSSLFSATAFKKDITDFIFNTTTSAVINGQEINRLTRPENGPSATLEGLEFIAQHSFENGFGFIANYTWTDIGQASVQEPVLIDGEATLREFDVTFPFASETMYNLTVYYEKHGLSARVNYSYRDEFFRQIVESGELWGDEQEQVDAQLSYQVSDNFTVRLEALNLTEESIDQIYQSAQGHDLLASQFYNGRRFFIGVNYQY